MADSAEISIAIETTCRAGGVALGVGDELVEVVDFDAARRAATQVVTRLKGLLDGHGRRPDQINHLYVAVGPGSFTGTRVGVTVARTLGQAFPTIRCVAVPTAEAVVEAVEPGERIEHVGVILDARRGRVWAALFDRSDDRWVSAGSPTVAAPETFLAAAPRPLHLLGEGLGYHDLSGEDVTIFDAECWLPTVGNVWRVGRRLARAGRFVDYHRLTPIYTGQPEAVRAWREKTADSGGEDAETQAK